MRQLFFFVLFVIACLVSLFVGAFWVTTMSTNALVLLSYCIGYFMSIAVAFYAYAQLKGIDL
jgi:ABC-type proline/glycine betaine transport system permease subunit